MCDYEAEYYDYEEGGLVLYKCPHEPSKPRCMFHDGSSYKSRPDDVRNEFYKMVEDAIQNDQPLYCIGFNLPDIIVNGKKFVKPVYFTHATFQRVLFKDVTFQQVNFLYATFYNQAYFISTTFKQLTDFSFAEFRDKVEFIHIKFPSSKEIDISRPLFSWDDDPKKIIKVLNEIIPTDCGWLYNAKPQVNKTEIIVSKPPHKLSIRLDLTIESSLPIILKINNEKEVVYWFITKEKKNKLYLYQYIPITFRYAIFEKLVRFIGNSDEPLDLSNVSFKGVDLDNVEFHNVKWREDKVLRFIKRNIVADELFMDELKNYQEVSRIYNQLRKNYEMHLHFTEASHFFIGEMEAIRRSLWSKGIRGKLASIPYLFYKYIALYGENVLLPLVVWTPIIIILFAVWRILVSSCYDRVIDSIAAYFQVPRNTLQPTAQDIIERILAVPILGSAFIALRRRFERRK
jgi:uncharacterized protein YjbI with pentapeptide repeats